MFINSKASSSGRSAPGDGVGATARLASTDGALERDRRPTATSIAIVRITPQNLGLFEISIKLINRFLLILYFTIPSIDYDIATK
jgi:hypothetical protein